ncbi:MAG: hypothetical protein V1874_07340 [Spirochaetota bacterium]
MFILKHQFFLSKTIKASAGFLLFNLIIFFPSVLYPLSDSIDKYLEQKALSDYEGALKTLEDRTFIENDPVTIEMNMFRIYELSKYPELTDSATGLFKKLLANRTVENNPALKARANILLNLLYLKKGNMYDASIVKANLGFINKFRISAPVKNKGDFGKLFKNEANAEVTETEWFNAQTDPSGKVDLADFFGEVSGCLFYLKSSITVPEDGNYLLWLGKTGYTDIWIDGGRIFSGRMKHGFLFDQYCITVALSGGTHDLLIKTGDSICGAGIAVRLTDEKGRAVNNAADHYISNISVSPDVQVRPVNTSLFYSLEAILKTKPAEGPAAFNAGYLYYISGLNSEEDGEAEGFFSGVNEGLPGSAAKYYSGVIAKDSQKKESYFNESVRISGENIESLNELAKIKLRKNQLYEAYRITDNIADINPGSIFINKLKAQTFLICGWYNEALKQAFALMEKMKPAGYELESQIYIAEKKYNRALPACRFLFGADKDNSGNIDNLIECLLKTGRYDEAAGLLTQCAGIFPNNVALRLKLAEIDENRNSAETVLPYLLSAKQISPHNMLVLLKIGLAYHKLNKDELAMHYLRKAQENDIKNELSEWIENYINNCLIIIPPNPTGGDLKKIESLSKWGSGEMNNWKGTDLERNIFKSFYSGNQNELINNIEKLLSAFSAEPESILYYPEIGRLNYINGSKRSLETLRGLINSVNSKERLSKKNLHILSLKLELEKLLYGYNLPEAKKISEEFYPIKRWSLLGPYSRFGTGDIDYPFMPEIITKINSSEIKKKDIVIQHPEGILHPAGYLFPENGIVYAVTSVSAVQPLKLRLYSDSSYKLFINGKEALRNLKNEIHRRCRIIKVSDSLKYTLMIKLHVKEHGNFLRVIVTDENDNILKTEADASEMNFSGFNFIEQTDYPYDYYNAELKNSQNKSNAYCRLGKFFREAGSPEAANYFRKAIAADDKKDPVKLFFLAECLFDLSNGDRESAAYIESRDIVNELVKHPDFIPAQHLSFKMLYGVPKGGFALGNMGEYSSSLLGLTNTHISGNIREMAESQGAKCFFCPLTPKGGKIGKNNEGILGCFIPDLCPLWGLGGRNSGYIENYLLMGIDYSRWLLICGYEKEFESVIDLLRKKFPHAVQPLLLLAEYYKDRDVFKSIELYKMIIEIEASEKALGEIIEIYKEQGRYENIEAIGLYDTKGRYRKDLIEALIDSGKYENARKAILYELSVKNDPHYNIKLGELNYIQGYDPVMYWQKALFADPSDYLLKCMIEYFENGKRNPFKLLDGGLSGKIKEKDKNKPSDIREFIVWYKGLLQGAFNIEIDRVNPGITGKTSVEQIKAVYNFTSRQIKLQPGALYSPHKAMDTYFKKKGSAEDKVIFALSALSEFGIKSYIAFAAGSSDAKNGSPASQKDFTNILLYVPLDVKTGLWLDFSDAQNECGAVSDRLAGKDAFVIIKDSYDIKKITGDQ